MLTSLLRSSLLHVMSPYLNRNVSYGDCIVVDQDCGDVCAKLRNYYALLQFISITDIVKMMHMVI